MNAATPHTMRQRLRMGIRLPFLVRISVFQDSVPTYLTIEKTLLLIKGYNYKHRRTNDMVFRHKTPVAGVGGTVTVITHHPVVIELKRIIFCLFTVDEYLAVFHVEVIPLIYAYRPAIDRKVLEREMQRASAFRDPELAHIGRVQP